MDVVSDAIGMDKRIGRRYLTGGFGYGGPCFPRDNVALNFIGQHLGASCEILRVNDQFNRTIARRYVEKLKPLVREGATVAVLGLAYKPLSHVIEESSGIFLCRALADHGLRVVGYDPLANQEARIALRDHALIASSIDECLRDAEMVLVTTPDAKFIEIKPEQYLSNKHSVILVDFWRCLPDSVKSAPGIDYLPMGQCQDDEKAIGRLHDLWQGTIG